MNILLLTSIGLFLILLFIIYKNQQLKNSTKILYKQKEELEKQKSLHELVLKNSSNSVVIYDLKTKKFIECNENAVKLLECDSKEEMFALNLDDLSPEYQPNGEKSSNLSAEKIKLVIQNGTDSFEWLHLSSKGNQFWVDITLTYFILQGRKILYGTWKNITDKKKIEQENIKLQERVELALLGSNDGLWDWNILDDTIYFSPRWKEMLGFNDYELPNEMSSWEDRVHPDDIQNAIKDIEKNIQGATDYYENIHRIKHKNGSWIWTLDRGKVQFDHNGKAIRMIGTHRDITNIQEMQLKYSQQVQIIEQIHDSVITTDLDGYITSWNKGSELLLEYTESQVLGKHITMLYLEEDYEALKESIDQLMKNGEYYADKRLVKKSKQIVYIALSLSILKDSNGKPTAMVGYAQDITERKIAEEKLHEQKNILHHQAHHDDLTQLPNRAFFNDRLEQAIQRAKRNKTLIALFYIDLDHFKQINDSLGHEIGDKVLQVTADRLKNNIRKEDTLSRLGGDEFTLIVEELNIAKDVSVLAQKIIEDLEKPIHIDTHTLYISSSIGISIYPNDDTDAKNLLKYADSAMYKAKEEGRNNFQFYSSEMTELAFEHLAMEVSLRQALANEEFVVHYQPQINGSDNSLIGMEALIRWNHPTLGMVPPYKFIPIAEKNGLIIQIDQWVMRSAMTQLSSWYKEGLNPGVLSMNLAIKQLQKKDFIEVMRSLLEETRCKPEWIELEVTEGQIMTNPEEAIKILNQISDMGIELAIDDFGTGYSSLSYLKKLPLDKLKIDRSFIKDLPDDDEDIGITKSVIALSKSLNLKVIAEGVETKEQKDFLVENGCHNIQGYFYSKPISADEIYERFLKKS
ncbi:EAL domain-containing protein [Sulfurimonas sp.]|uniref:bifunctional diguanylate cyclase/phosphodiesterase n=1 Tax=Sulfurimonas sp. TaxID=2022749 RepID=UPI0035685F6F